MKTRRILKRCAFVAFALGAAFSAKAMLPDDPEHFRVREQKWQQFGGKEQARKQLAEEKTLGQKAADELSAQKKIAKSWRGYRARTRTLPMMREQQMVHIADLLNEIFRQRFDLAPEKHSPQEIMLSIRHNKGIERVKQLYAIAEKMADRYESAVKLMASIFFRNMQQHDGDWRSPDLPMPDIETVFGAACDYKAHIFTTLQSIAQQIANKKWFFYRHVMVDNPQIIDMAKAKVRYKLNLITKSEYTNLMQHPEALKREAKMLARDALGAIKKMAADLLGVQIGLPAFGATSTPEGMFRRYGAVFNGHDRMIFDEFWPIVNEYVQSQREH